MLSFILGIIQLKKPAGYFSLKYIRQTIKYQVEVETPNNETMGKNWQCIPQLV